MQDWFTYDFAGRILTDSEDSQMAINSTTSSLHQSNQHHSLSLPINLWRSLSTIMSNLDIPSTRHGNEKEGARPESAEVSTNRCESNNGTKISGGKEQDELSAELVIKCKRKYSNI